MEVPSSTHRLNKMFAFRQEVTKELHLLCWIPDPKKLTLGAKKLILVPKKLVQIPNQDVQEERRLMNCHQEAQMSLAPMIRDASGITSEGNGPWLQYSDLMSDSYPAKSKFVYLKAYRDFEKFLKARNQWEPNTCPTDLQVLNYFHYLRHELKHAPTTLWSLYARINAVMKRVFGVSLNSYSRVGDVLKSYDSGHVVKKAGIFTPQQIEDFVTDPALSSKYWLVRKCRLSCRLLRWVS